jgi:hypothetical protein
VCCIMETHVIRIHDLTDAFESSFYFSACQFARPTEVSERSAKAAVAVVVPISVRRPGHFDKMAPRRSRHIAQSPRFTAQSTFR